MRLHRLVRVQCVAGGCADFRTLVGDVYDWGKVLPAFSQQRVPDAHASRSCRIIRFLATRGWWLSFSADGRRLLHQWFPSWVKPFVFDLVLDTDLSYSQVLSLSQGWINMKRSMPDHG